MLFKIARFLLKAGIPTVAGVALTLISGLAIPYAFLEVSESVRAMDQGASPAIAHNDLFYLKGGAIYGKIALGEEQLLFENISATAVVAAQANDDNYLVWETAQGIFFSKNTNTNGTFELPTQLTSTAGDTDIAIAATTSKIYVLFSRQINSANSEIFLKSFAGGSWQPETQLTNFNGQSTAPDGCFDSQGNFYLVWTDDRKGQDQPWIRVKDSSGWSEETLLLDDPNNPGLNVKVASLGTTVYASFIQDSKCYLKIGSGLSFSSKVAIANDVNNLAIDAREDLLCIIVRKNTQLYFKTKSAAGWSSFTNIAAGSDPDIWSKGNSRISCTFLDGGTVYYIDLMEQPIVNESEMPIDYDAEENFEEAFESQYYKTIVANDTRWDRANDYVRDNFLPEVWDALEDTGIPMLEKISDTPLVAVIMMGGLATITFVAVSVVFTKQDQDQAEEPANDNS